MYHKVCFVQSCVFVQIAQGLKFISFLNKSYYPYFGTEESQYLIYFPNARCFCPALIREQSVVQRPLAWPTQAV